MQMVYVYNYEQNRALYKYKLMRCHKKVVLKFQSSLRLLKFYKYSNEV